MPLFFDSDLGLCLQGVLSREKAELERDRGFDLVNTSEHWVCFARAGRRADLSHGGIETQSEE